MLEKGPASARLCPAFAIALEDAECKSFPVNVAKLGGCCLKYSVSWLSFSWAFFNVGPSGARVARESPEWMQLEASGANRSCSCQLRWQRQERSSLTSRPRGSCPGPSSRRGFGTGVVPELRLIIQGVSKHVSFVILNAEPAPTPKFKEV